MPFSWEHLVNGVLEIDAGPINDLAAKVGDDNSAVATSLDYLLRNPASLDPGHRHSLFAQTITSAAACTRYTGLLTASLTLNPSGNATGVYRAVLQSILTVDPASMHSIASIIGGLEVWAENKGTGTINMLRGGEIFGYNSGNATINYLYGAIFSVQSDAGTVGEMVGLNVGALSFSVATDMYGLKIGVDISGGSSTNRYGIYLTAPAGAATYDFGIYQAGLQKNYFRGNVGIGVVPLDTIHVHVEVGSSYTQARLTNKSTGTNAGGFISLFSVAGDSGLVFSANRSVSDGAFIDTARAHAEIQIHSKSADSYISFLTGAANNTTGAERLRIKGTGTINIAALTSYANNAAALSGGLVAGDLYRIGDTVGVVH